MTQAQPIFNTRHRLGEGPVWHDGLLYYIDIESKRVYRGNVSTKITEILIDLPSRVGFISPRITGGWVLGLEDGLYSINDDWSTKSLTRIVPIEADRNDLRINDGKPDPAGRLWLGSSSLKGEKERAGLYCVDKTLSVRRMVDKVNLSNGLAWSNDARKMYYIDTPLRTVDAFDFDASSGDISNRKTIYTLTGDQGHPDGMTIDADGRLWVACWGGSGVLCIDPASGELVSRIDVPCPNVTCCCFGGEALDTLYITTASEGMDAASLEKYPLAGQVFQTRIAGVRGAAVAAFAG